MSRMYKTIAATLAVFSVAGAASANCGSGLYCGQSSAAQAQPISSWSGHAAAQSYSTLSAHQADATYGTGSISETYSAPQTHSFTGATSSVAGLGVNERLQATNCPVNVHDVDEGRVIGCYNVVRPVPQTTYYRVVRPIVYVRYPVPVAVPYTSPCHTVTHHSRYGDFGSFRGKRSCR